jgi:hypothetical protein
MSLHFDAATCEMMRQLRMPSAGGISRPKQTSVHVQSACCTLKENPCRTQATLCADAGPS